MPINQLTTNEQVGLYDVYLSGANFYRDVKMYLSKPDVQERIINTVYAVSQVLIVAVIIKTIWEM